jgi:hypothetical protein
MESQVKCIVFPDECVGGRVSCGGYHGSYMGYRYTLIQ